MNYSKTNGENTANVDGMDDIDKDIQIFLDSFPNLESLYLEKLLVEEQKAKNKIHFFLTIVFMLSLSLLWGLKELNMKNKQVEELNKQVEELKVKDEKIQELNSKIEILKKLFKRDYKDK